MLRRLLGRGLQRAALGRPRPLLFLFISNTLTRFSLPRLRPVLTPWNCVWSRQFSKHSPGNWVKIPHESIAVSSYKVSRLQGGEQCPGSIFGKQLSCLKFRPRLPLSGPSSCSPPPNSQTIIMSPLAVLYLHTVMSSWWIVCYK